MQLAAVARPMQLMSIGRWHHALIKRQNTGVLFARTLGILPVSGEKARAAHALALGQIGMPPTDRAGLAARESL